MFGNLAEMANLMKKVKDIQKNMVDSKTTIILGVPAIFENMYKKIIVIQLYLLIPDHLHL